MTSVIPSIFSTLETSSSRSASSLTPTRTAPSAPPSIGQRMSWICPRLVSTRSTSGSAPPAPCSSRRCSGIPFEKVCAITRSSVSSKKIYDTKSLLRFSVWISSSSAKRLPVCSASLLSSATSAATLSPRRSSDARMMSDSVTSMSAPERMAKSSTIPITITVSLPAMRSFAKYCIRSPLPARTADRAPAVAARSGR